MKKLLIFFLPAFLIAGCSKDNELKKSVFIYDYSTNGLPEYSEWGYNTFGAYYDREIFVSTNEQVPAKVFSSDTATQLIFEGRKNAGYYSDGNIVSMTFTLSGYACKTYEDLVALHDTIIDLHNPKCHVNIMIDSEETVFHLLVGNLHIKRAQNLTVDKEPVEVILSGVFYIQALVNGEPVTISDGRFDIGIGPDNFYFY